MTKRFIGAALWGGLVGILTLAIENLVGRAISIPLMILIFPGLIGSMVITGNVHAFPIALAALLNTLIHTGLCWGLLTLISYRKESKKQAQTADLPSTEC
jgi:hypothetical protein